MMTPKQINSRHIVNPHRKEEALVLDSYLSSKPKHEEGPESSALLLFFHFFQDKIGTAKITVFIQIFT